MLEKNFSRIKYVLLLALFLVVPLKAWAGAGVPTPGFGNTDGLSMQLVSFWDLRDRDTFVQVTNTSSSDITVHVQIFNLFDNCSDLDFYDLYTGNDTHVYNLRDIVGNTNPNVAISLPDDTLGMIVVTVVDGAQGIALANDVLTGNFRIIDKLGGFEYRSNSDGWGDENTLTGNPPNALSAVLDGFTAEINFNNAGGANRADVVGLPLFNAGPGFTEVFPGGITFDVNLYDPFELQTSCDFISFFCGLDFGINDALPESRELTFESLCDGSVLETGSARLDPAGFFADFFTGYVGLNNGDGTGSMDTWVLTLDSPIQPGVN